MTIVTKTVKVRTVENVTASDVINSVGGKWFSVRFEKADGTMREMRCRRGVKKHLKGGTSTIAGKPELISVFDIDKGEYRCFNINKVHKIRANGAEYEFSN